MSEKRPNFVFLLTDSQGSDLAGCYSRRHGAELRTPHIDRLAREGVKFERAYCASPICTPDRAAIFSGIHAHSSGPWTNSLALGTNIPHLGRRFSDLGYRTPYIGKWHLDGHDYFGTGKCPEGFEDKYWYDGKRYLDDLSDREIALWRHGLQTIEDLRRESITREFTWGGRITDRALDFLENDRQADEPFFLTLCYDEPHHPWTCPPEFAEPFREFDFDLGPAGRDDLRGKPAHQREWAEAMEHPARDGKVRCPLLFGCNSFIDDEVGRVVEAVRRLGLDRNTYIIYSSDHGEMLGAHGLSLKGCVAYEEITRVPLIIKPPTGAPSRRVKTLVSHIDLLPTFLDLAGEPPPPSMHGGSLRPYLLEGREDPDRAAFMEFNRYEITHDSFGGFKPMRVIVEGDYKLALHLLSTDELYNLRQDPDELVNLIDDPAHAEARGRLHHRLLDWMEEKRDPFRGPEWERRPWQADRRRGWMGLYRPAPRDGYAPRTRDYDTGMPSTGVKIEAKTTPKADE